MTTKTRIIEKDSALQSSIHSMQQTLKDIGFDIIEESNLNPISNVWSVDIYDRDCPLLLSNGKSSSKNNAHANALKVFFERLSTHYFWANFYLGDNIAKGKFVHYAQERWFKPETNGSWPDGILNSALQDFYNPDSELNVSALIDINSSDSKRGICTLPYRCQRTGESLYFPVNIVDNLYASNGISAGQDKEEVRIQALSEIFKHYIKFKIISEGLSLPNVPKEVLNRYPNAVTRIDHIEKATGYSLFIQDASLNGQYPVIAILLFNPENQGTYIHCAAHPNFETALEQCIDTLFQHHTLDDINKLPEAGFDLDEIASPQNLNAHFLGSNGIVSWNCLKDRTDYESHDWGLENEGNTLTEVFDQLCDLVYKTGYDLFISEYQELGIYACRILIPGLSEIYPVDDLIWENNNAGIDVRTKILKQHKSLKECEQLIEQLEDLNLDDKHLVSNLIGILADQNSIFKDLRIAELITLLALKTQDNERIQEGCEWLLHFKKINPKRLKTYQCINTILQLDDMTGYATALNKLYGHETLSNALNLIDGKDVFPLNSDWESHELLIKGYQKVINYQEKPR